MSFQRLRSDFQFGTVILFGAIAVLCIAPFAVYRFAAGQLLVGLFDSAIMLCILGGMIHAWRGGKIERAGIAIMATSTFGVVAVIVAIGPSSVPWMYPVLVANFLIVSRQTATALSMLAITAVALQDAAFPDQLHRTVFVITSVVVSGFAFVFAHRTGAQRQRLESLASHDALTGAYNRRAMERELAVAVESHRRHRTPIGLAVMDLDHFKQINDSYGHEAGDRVLIEFVTLVSTSTRKGDRLFRFGGEEFVLLLQGPDLGALRTSAEGLRAIVASQLRCRGETITVSIGAAALEPGEDVSSWMARADAAMYRAKRDGRNRVVVDAGSKAPRPEPSEAVAEGL